MALEGLRARIRLLLYFNILPNETPETVWAGAVRTLHQCDGCGRTIRGTEYELTFSRRRTVFFHFACYRVWEQERMRAEPGDEPDATDVVALRVA